MYHSRINTYNKTEKIPSRPTGTNFSLQIWRQLRPISQSLPELDPPPPPKKKKKKKYYTKPEKYSQESLFQITTVK